MIFLLVSSDGTLRRDQAEQELVGERRTYRVLYQPGHRPRAHLGIEALARKVVAQGLGEARLDFLLLELLLELHEELVHDPQDDLAVERVEGDDRIEPVAKLRREH